MKYLTEKEINFIEALKMDKQNNGNKSFLEILWHSGFEPEDELRKEIQDCFEDYYKELFNDSDIILFSIDGLYVGKYKDCFWGTGTECEVFGMGKEIQNIVLQIIDAYYGDVLDSETKEDVKHYFKNNYNLDYDEYIQLYRDFCASLGFEYKEDWNLMTSQSEDFNKILPNLE